MKTYFGIIVVFLCLPVVGIGQQKQIRVSLQMIQVPHATLTELLAGEDQSGPALHAKATAFCKEGRARVMETSIVTCLSGNKASVDSIREEIYPTEYDSGDGLGSPVGVVELAPVAPPLRPVPMTAFETRNTGVSVEVCPTLGKGDQIVDLILAAEVVTPLRLDTWLEHVDEWGDASLRFPVFETWRFRSSVALAVGKFELVTVLSPKPTEGAPAATGKLLVFVRADVLPLPVSP